ncbi:hypothetical protein [Salinicola acroporae]|uniref:hypothetical protein n=1 Tax=Salinicola acroporae TaxID=1541440 RepID=UPI0013A66EB6|nr:hypothetical protein [Salinicola acroporae]
MIADYSWTVYRNEAAFTGRVYNDEPSPNWHRHGLFFEYREGIVGDATPPLARVVS